MIARLIEFLEDEIKDCKETLANEPDAKFKTYQHGRHGALDEIKEKIQELLYAKAAE
jgi:oligoribonuclease (3'-5' exoribonuclease)